MCFVLIDYCNDLEWPLFLAANRDEFYARPSTPPRIEPGGRTRYLAPRDELAGGTWIGINERGFFAVITNRTDSAAAPLPGARSRGQLVRECLEAGDGAAALAVHEDWARTPCAPYNLVFGDASSIVVIERPAGDRVTQREFGPGTIVVTDKGAADDRALGEVARAHREWRAGIAAGVDFWRLGARLLAQDKPDGDLPPLLKQTRVERGTVSGSLVGVHRSGAIRYEYSDGPPNRQPFVAIALDAGFAGDRRGAAI
ncbi:MAG: NRDE family protein [Planctomycetota bacterium]